MIKRFPLALLVWALLTCGVGLLATAQVPLTGAGVGAPGVVVSATTWSPSDKGTLITLSGGDLTWASGNNWASVRSVAALAANQKVYYEQTAVSISFAFLMGFANASANLNTGGVLAGQDAAILASNNIYHNTGSADDGANPVAAIAATDHLDSAFDSGALLIWYRKNNGAWNPGLAGTQNPATGQGGLSVVLTGPIYAIAGGGDIGDSGTARFSSGSWLNAAPAGFTQLQ